MNELKLVLPTKDNVKKIKEFKDEMSEYNSSFDGTGTLKTTDSIKEWIEYCYLCMNKETCDPNLVTATQYLCIREADDKLIGMIQIRHELNDFLRKAGGHIGYAIRPTERKKGYATEMLRLGLLECDKLGLKQVLITCIDSNIGSEKTILNNGGEFFETYYEQGRDVTLKKFWVDTQMIKTTH